MTTEDKFGVDTYQINVGQGDCSIHLKVEKTAPKRTCLAAVLIDGGRVYKGSNPNIKATMKEIEEKYIFPAACAGKLKFDAMVVTHWHEDHAEGVFMLVREDLLEQSLIEPLPTSSTIEVSFMKYNPGTPRTPATYMYFPNFNFSTSKYHVRRKKTSSTQLDFQDTKFTWWENICLYRCNKDQSLGVNFFANQVLAVDDLEKIEKPEDLVNKNPPEDGHPAMYCIASNGVTFDKIKDIIHRAVKVVPEPDEENGRKGKNSTSIATLVMWKSGRISHYTAGDLPEKDGEDRLVHWLTENKCKLASMKASHHGSHTSFPPEIMTGSLKPKTIVISCGERMVPTRDLGNHYFHPRWELILWLRTAVYAENLVGKTRVFSISYPSYFNFTEFHGRKSYVDIDFVVDAFVDKAAYYEDYRQSLKDLEEKRRSTSLNVKHIVDEFTKFSQGKDRHEKQKWIVEVTKVAWDYLCKLPETAQTTTGGRSSTGNTATTASLVQYVYVQSRSNEDEDGKAWYKMSNADWLLWEATPTSSPLIQSTSTQSSSTQSSSSAKRAEKTSTASKPSAATQEISNPRKVLPGTLIFPQGRGQELLKEAAEPTSHVVTATSDTIDNPRYIGYVSDVASTTSSDTDTIDDPRYYVYASDVTVTDEHYHVVTDEQQRAFIKDLHRQVLVLETVLPSGNPDKVKLDSSDELYAWLQDCMGATLSARGKDTDIQSFSLEMPVTGKTTLTFDTETTALQFNVPNAIGTWSLVSGYNVIVLGLQSALSSITLDDTFKLIEMDLPAVVAPLKALNLSIIAADKDKSGSLYQRNAIWFVPAESYTTVLRLQLQVSNSDVEKLNAVIAPFLGKDSFAIKTAQFIAKKSMNWSLEGDGLFVRSEPEARFIGTAALGKTLDLDFLFSASGDGSWSAALGYNRQGLSFQEILQWLLNTNLDSNCLISFFVDDDWKRVLEDYVQAFHFYQVVSWLSELVGVELDFYKWIPESVCKALPKFRRAEIFGTSDKKITGFNLTFEIQLNFGGEDGETTLILLCYSWPNNSLTGTLWQPPLQPDFPYVLHPSFESSSDITFPQIQNLTKRLSLAKLHPGDEKIVDIPEQLFPYVDFASLEISSTGIKFMGTLSWEAATSATTVPMTPLATVELYASYTWKEKAFELALMIKAMPPLRNGGENKYSRMLLEGGITYADQTWTLHAGAYGLNIAALYEFFDSDSRDGVMDMLEAMEIQQLSVDGTFSKGKLTSLDFKGILLLGGLEADLQYKYEVTDESPVWRFEIGLGAREAKATIGDIVASIVGPDFVLPACVSSIEVKKTPESKIFSISVSKVNGANQGTILFNGNFEINGLGFTFVQIKAGKDQSTKRVIKVAVSHLPTATLPLVGELPQPFDELAFLWVDDNGPVGGLTRAEVGLINTHVFASNPGIRFKEPKPTGKKENDIVLRTGLHLLITLHLRGESKVILDHCFGSTKKPPSLTTLALARDTDEKLEVGITKGDSEVTTAPMEKTIGVLRISNIGLQYKNDTLYIVMDASFHLGPMTVALLGFGIGVAFNGKNTLQNLPKSLSVTIQGLGVGFNKPPITMDGLFDHTESADMDIYQGAMTVGFDLYTITAAGFYGTANIKSSADQYKTVFVFAQLTGPLVQLEFGEISGVCAGFGYNNIVRQPSVEQVVEFPFISGNIPTGTSPVEALNSLTKPGGWVIPRHDTFWLAAGLDVKALDLICLDAVVIVEFNPDVKLGIYAIGQGTMPPNSTHDKSFLFIEFGILASVDFGAGIFKVERQLSPNSFILAPACHLQGGFALFYWFSGSKYEGDWVYSMGGYHPGYKPPDHYPLPQRLGINWTVGGGISIQGLSYFSMTPKCCMAGGQLSLALSLGPLSAWLHSSSNFLINFNPFYFMGNVKVSVGVAYTMDLWLTTVHIKVEIGAELMLSGSPFQGSAHVDFWVFGFTISFGGKAEEPHTLTLDEFLQLLLQQGIQQRRNSSIKLKRQLQSRSEGVATGAPVNDHVFAVESGLVPSADNKEDNSLWIVRGGILVFMIQSRFAVDEASFDKEVTKGPDTAFYAKPMRLTSAITSKLVVTINKQEEAWRIEPLLKSVPVAIWGKYTAETDPQVSGNNIDALLSAKDATMELMMGVYMKAPKPTLSQDKIPQFNLVNAMAQDVYEKDENPSFPPTAPKQKSAWQPAESLDLREQYQKLKDAWSNPEGGKETGKTVLKAWKMAFMWEEKDTKDITGALPVKAIEGLGDLYMDAPRLSSA